MHFVTVLSNLDHTSQLQSKKHQTIDPNTHTRKKKEKKRNKKRKMDVKQNQSSSMTKPTIKNECTQVIWLAGVDVNTNYNEEDCDEAEVNDGMDQDRSTACLHVPKLDQPPSRWYLKQQPRTQQHKQHHCYYHWPPVRHITLSALKTEAFRKRKKEIQRQRHKARSNHKRVVHKSWEY